MRDTELLILTRSQQLRSLHGAFDLPTIQIQLCQRLQVVLRQIHAGPNLLTAKEEFRPDLKS